MPVEEDYKDVILNELFRIQNDIKEIIAITVKQDGTLVYRTSQSNAADNLYCLEATKFQLMQNQFDKYSKDDGVSFDD